MPQKLGIEIVSVNWRGAAVLAAGFLGLCGTQAACAGGVGLAAHRAIYDLVLDRSSQANDLADLTGRIVMEFSGSQCRGYSLALRFRTEIFDQEGDLRITDARTKTFEDGDGRGFEFVNETFVDDTLTEESRGKADRTDGSIAVALTRPDGKNFVLDGAVLFPTEQIVRIIEAGRSDQNFLQADVYEGLEDGETVYATTVVVGEGSDSSRDLGEEIAMAEAGVAGVMHWPVTVSYFDQETRGEQTPLYVMSFILYENGISRRLKIDYGDFIVIGRLTDLEMLPEAGCPAGGR